MRARRVLIVDDSEDVTELLSIMVESERHVSRTASSGAEALSIASWFRPDVVLLDLGMPDLDGFEVCSLLRSTAASRNAVIVAVTGSAQPNLRDRALAVGFDYFYLKPIPLEEMRELLLRQRLTS